MTLEQEIEVLKAKVELYRFDYLTKLKMRRDFYYEVGKLINKQMFYLMKSDIDNLHNHNNEFGEKAGDILIQKVAYDIQSIDNQKGTYRTGGDEFMTILLEKPIVEIENATSACVFSGDYHTLEAMIKDVDVQVTKKKILLDRRR